ncbi:hybrid sensor histidine kinase/response regulator [Thalassotalea hakodatensis]|uniref:hybrid sensor histidine kinase/response regulator n=1 Tax=Thalassotalea hakodatensis TaxID=3030492 RepID=UPI002572C029|nr:PAS domain-containing sensor histidine kinase [Thalassotalea hakodatensis]
MTQLNLESIPYAVIRVNTQARIIECNHVAEKLTGYASQEIEGLYIEQFVQSGFDNLEQLLNGDLEKNADQDPTIAIINKNTQSVSCSIKVTHSEIDAILYLTKILPVSNNRVPTRQSSYLQLSEKLFRSGHWRLDLNKQQVYWSDGIYEIHGVNKQEYSPTLATAIDFYEISERPKVEHFINQAIQGKCGFHFKSSIIHTLGKKVKVEVIGDIETNEKGDVVAIYGVFRDITKNEEVFEKLKLLALVNYTITVPIFFIDDKDNVVYQDLSPQMGNQNAVLFNYINFSIKDYLYYKRLAKEKGQVIEKDISFDKYNSVFSLSVTYEPDEGIYIWIVENTTEKFRQDQQQFISNRLALLGNTFGNVSHDINNVLGVALGATEMLELKAAKGEGDISKYIDRVKNAIDKGKTVTERLLAFTRKPTVKVVEFDPIKEIEDNLYLFKQLLLNTITFNVEHSDIKCVVMFPQGEFINILLNVVLNAQDAIREKSPNGEIQLSVNIIDNNKLRIRVKDSGVGIKQENLSKIFDPFYSSKSVNKGNGIGLANVYSTMYKYDGEVQVAGECDLGGAEFSLLFPCKFLDGKNNLVKEDQNDIGIEGKSILILDDEVSIAEFVALFLEDEGANTEFVTNKVELEAKLNDKRRYDIFITDMILPDLSGREAVDMVATIYPDIKVYSMSGYIAEENNEWHYPVLRKPFNAKELASFLKEHR